MNEPKLEIVEVPDDIEETPFLSFYTNPGDLLVKNTDPGEDFGPDGIMGFIPVEAIPTLRKHLNEGMVERWVLSSELKWVSHTTKDEAWKSNQPNENLEPIRILVPAEPSND